MADHDVQRRLAAILAADVVGYSRLIEADEDAALTALRAHRRNVFDPTVARYGGRIFKEMGDGFLVEFASVVNAVRCAIDIQGGMAEANRDTPPDRRISFRIGVNLGDVVVEGADLHGDGVNVAARLEGLATPGGICISAPVHDQIRRRLSVRFDDMGLQTLKNLSRPVQVFRLRPADGAPGPLPLPDKPSIAVLPFTNMSSDTEYEHFVDGLTEDLITDLSRTPGLFVIARNSVFAYKGKPTDVRQIARDLGVRHLLEGSARRAGDRVRINVQLIDSIGGGHVWAERFDRKLDDIFDLQDEVSARIVTALVGQLVTTPRKRTHSVQAYDLCMRGRALLDGSVGAGDALSEAAVLLEAALDLDPAYPEAHRCLAMVLNDAWMHAGLRVTSRHGPALNLARRAVTLDPDDSSCHATHALLLDYAGQWDAAQAGHERALALDPNNADAMVVYSDFLLFAGQHDRADDLVTRALRINPLPPAWYHMSQGKIAYAQGRYADAVHILRHPATYRTVSRRYLAASLARLGRLEEAWSEAELYMAANPRFTIGHWRSASQFRDAATMAHFVEGYRLAGLPE